LQGLHIWPINLVVFKASLSRPKAGGKFCLEGGLALICLQRLSFPSIATQLVPLAR